VALYLINRKIAGDDIPASLPPSLVPPSMRSKVTPSSPPVSLSPRQLAKFKSPPPPPPKRELHAKRPHSGSSVSVNSSTSDYFSPLKLPTPPLPPNPTKSPKVQSSYSTSPSNHPETELISPFEDPLNGASASRHHSPLQASKPPPPDHSNNEALEELKKEASRLRVQVDSLLSAQTNLQDANETSRKENDLLKAQMREMERTVSEVLSANDQNGSQEQYIQEIGRLSTELASKEAESESTQRMLAVLTEEDTDLRRQLRESQASTTKAKSEVEDLRQNVASREGDITELRAQLSDMGKAMAEGPASTSSNRELRVLLRDVTRENDRLKAQVRDMQTSMEQLLLSTKSHAKFDEVERENRRLQSHVQELEILATRLQTSAQRQQQFSDEVARENEQLKGQLQTGHRAFAEFQTSTETKIDELQRKLATMEHENNRLKMEVVNSSGQGQEDNTIPPPAYQDSFTIPE
jgi:epidermal growth factor receptor substrate 15